MSEQGNAIKIIRVKFWLLMSFQEVCLLLIIKGKMSLG